MSTGSWGETAFAECNPEGGWQPAGRINLLLFALSWSGRLSGVWRWLQAAIIHIILCYPHKRSCGLQGQTFPRGRGEFICMSSCRWVLPSLRRGQPGCYCMLRLLPWNCLSALAVVTQRGWGWGVSSTPRMHSVMEWITHLPVLYSGLSLAMSRLMSFHMKDGALNQNIYPKVLFWKHVWPLT